MNIIETSFEIIRGVFIQSDLVDINQTDAELCDLASYDSQAEEDAKRGRFTTARGDRCDKYGRMK